MADENSVVARDRLHQPPCCECRVAVSDALPPDAYAAHRGRADHNTHNNAPTFYRESILCVVREHTCP